MQIDRFHAAQIIGGWVLGGFAMLMYAAVPDDRKQFFEQIALMAIAFVFGKFTNGFKKS